MIDIDWSILGLGTLAGAMAGVLFFAGLALGMHLALRSAIPTPVLLLSSGLRIAALLSICWLVAQSGLVALTGFVLAFVAVRFAAITIARRPAETEISWWN
jgi:hypothetical protein